MTGIYNFLMSINDVVWFVLVPVLLIGGLFFTLRTGVIQITNLSDMFRSLNSKETDDGSISGVQAFFIGLASRVGTGNIAGVAIAIMIGGPGSIFWMWIVAIVGSASAFIESTLAQLYKVSGDDTKYKGGPAFYISKGLSNKPLAIMFAISIIIAYGLIFTAVQTNTISTSMIAFTSDNSILLNTIASTNITYLSVIISSILAIVVMLILSKGSNAIAKISTVIVPIMAGGYILLALLTIIINITYIPEMFNLIISEALSPQALSGGLSGVVIQQGVSRGLFSNEAGMGSAPNAAASAEVDHPVTQGLIQSLGVFVDTLLICTATAFIILLPALKEDEAVSTFYNGIDGGIAITQMALFDLIGQFAVVFLTISVFFFAFSTILGGYFYASFNLSYITQKESAFKVLKILIVVMIFFGGTINAQVVWDLADLFMGIMALINIYAILSLHDKVIILLKDFRKQKNENVKPIFDSSQYEELKEFKIWNKDIKE